MHTGVEIAVRSNVLNPDVLFTSIVLYQITNNSNDTKYNSLWPVGTFYAHKKILIDQLISLFSIRSSDKHLMMLY